MTRTTLDGFGRAIKVESGPGSLTYSASIQNIAISSVVSQVDSVYAPCGCSPMGKLTQSSRPHVPGATVYWTTNVYDGIGRTKSVQAPDSSTSTYLYSGATVTTTDPAGKWKKFLTDTAGNLTQVNELLTSSESPTSTSNFMLVARRRAKRLKAAQASTGRT